MQFNINEYRDFFIAADTDSAIFSLDPILKKEFGNDYKLKKTDEEVLNKMKEYLKKYSERLNNIYLNKLAKDKFNVINHKFNWKTENIIKTALWTGRRRYAQYIIEKEGVKVEEIDYKGLELNKSNSNPLFKEFGTNFIKQILFKTPKSQLDQLIINLHQKVKTLDPKTLGKPTGVSYINKCVKKSPSPGEILSELHLNTKPNSSGSIYYNDLLRFKKLDKKFPEIMEGAKVYVIDLIKNPYNINYISIPVNEKIPDFIEEFIKKYANIDQIFESSILNKLKELYKDLKMEFPNLNPSINKFFKW